MFGTRNLNLWDRLEVNIQVKWIPQTSSCTKVKFELSKEGALVQICTCPFPQHFFKVGVDPWTGRAVGALGQRTGHHRRTSHGRP